jgi:hypothetical protein
MPKKIRAAAASQWVFPAEAANPHAALKRLMAGQRAAAKRMRLPLSDLAARYTDSEIDKMSADKALAALNECHEEAHAKARKRRDPSKRVLKILQEIDALPHHQRTVFNRLILPTIPAFHAVLQQLDPLEWKGILRVRSKPRYKPSPLVQAMCELKRQHEHDRPKYSYGRMCDDLEKQKLGKHSVRKLRTYWERHLKREKADLLNFGLTPASERIAAAEAAKKARRKAEAAKRRAKAAKEKFSA